MGSKDNSGKLKTVKRKVKHLFGKADKEEENQAADFEEDDTQVSCRPKVFMLPSRQNDLTGLYRCCHKHQSCCCVTTVVWPATWDCGALNRVVIKAGSYTAQPCRLSPGPHNSRAGLPSCQSLTRVTKPISSHAGRL